MEDRTVSNQTVRAVADQAEEQGFTILAYAAEDGGTGTLPNGTVIVERLGREPVFPDKPYAVLRFTHNVEAEAKAGDGERRVRFWSGDYDLGFFDAAEIFAGRLRDQPRSEAVA